MKIVRIDIIVIGIPLKKFFETSFGIIKSRDTVLIKMYTEAGVVGYGESSLLSVSISEDEIISTGVKLLKEDICPQIINKNFKDIYDIKKILDKFPNHPITKIGIEGAFYDILSQEKNEYIGNLFNAAQQKIKCCESIGINDSRVILKEVKKFIDKGYDVLKVKIKPGHDVEIIELIKKNFRDVELGVDANCAYGVGEIDIFKKLEKFKLLYIEQPFKEDYFQEHALLQRKINIPICLDESIRSIHDAKKAIRLNSCKVVNIKPARIGSYHESKLIHDLCYENKIGVFCGGRQESGIGKILNLALAGLHGFNYPLDLSSTLEYFEDDIISPSFSTVGGFVEVPKKIGPGYFINEKKIDKYIKDLISIKN